MSCAKRVESARETCQRSNRVCCTLSRLFLGRVPRTDVFQARCDEMRCSGAVFVVVSGRRMFRFSKGCNLGTAIYGGQSVDPHSLMDPTGRLDTTITRSVLQAFH